MNVPHRRFANSSVVLVPLGLLAIALVAICSAIWPAQRPRDPGSID